MFTPCGRGVTHAWTIFWLGSCLLLVEGVWPVFLIKLCSHAIYLYYSFHSCYFIPFHSCQAKRQFSPCDVHCGVNGLLVGSAPHERNLLMYRKTFLMVFFDKHTPWVSKLVIYGRAFLTVFFEKRIPWVSNLIIYGRSFLTIFFYKCTP